MPRIRTSLSTEQAKALRTLTAETGRTRSDLIREGGEALLKRHRARAKWKQATLALAGVWADRETVEADVAEGRALGERRLDRLLSDSS